jgi:hypothetical protein
MLGFLYTYIHKIISSCCWIEWAGWAHILLLGTVHFSEFFLCISKFVAMFIPLIISNYSDIFIRMILLLISKF